MATQSLNLPSQPRRNSKVTVDPNLKFAEKLQKKMTKKFGESGEVLDLCYLASNMLLMGECESKAEVATRMKIMGPVIQAIIEELEKAS